MSEPLEQAEAILKAAEEATPGDWQSQHQNDLDSQLTIIGNVDGPDDGRFTFTNICDVDETPDECFANARLIILARNTAPAIALALIEKHKALEEAEARIAALEAALRPFAKIEVPRSADAGTWVARTLHCNDQVTAHSVWTAREALGRHKDSQHEL